MNDTIVLGLGNPLMGDEGVGVRIVQELQSTWGNDFPQVDFLDAGTGGMGILHWIAGRRKAVFIDCALMGEQPGSIRRFTPDQVRTQKVLAHQSLHEADILNIIDVSRHLGECPDQVVFFGIEPESIAERIGLSPPLENQLPQYLNEVISELRIL
ncbi:MAG: HyaD/HybD family hydrogenase maturation endopeptidase [Sedimentisphaerales bacterium]|nr:HyaD/HybD family hydrogenase maturation endopeptidase [Sedimentisphaerales bacterium]